MRMTKMSIAAAILLAGCSTHPAQPLQEDYGSSVHSLLQNQTASPNAATASNGTVVEGANPDMVNTAVKALQADIGKGENIRKPPNVTLEKELGSQ